MLKAKRPVFYTGGGVINSGKKAVKLLHELVEATNFPITSTLMGLGGLSGLGQELARHARQCTAPTRPTLAMHGCDLMVNIGARFDDRITGRIDAFSPGSKKIHIDIDPSSINKIIHVDLGIVGDVGEVLEEMLEVSGASRPRRLSGRR